MERKSRKIGIIGHFGGKENILDGQTNDGYWYFISSHFQKFIKWKTCKKYNKNYNNYSNSVVSVKDTFWNGDIFGN